MRKALNFALFGVFGLALSATSALGALGASATISSQQLSQTSYQYNVTLTNTGDTNISTLWLGWIPAYDLMPSATSNFTAPAGWTGIDAPDAFGVASARWETTTAPLAAGQSLGGFSFTSPDSPAVLAGTSFFGFPILETYVFINGPQTPTDAGAALVPTVVAAPEPSSVAMLLGLPALLIRRKRR